MARLAAACVVAGIAWILCEVIGGLAFLAAGIRLWRYDILPVFWAITSPIVWIFALLLIVPLTIAFEKRYTVRLARRQRLAAVAAFVAVTGPVLEVIINETLFRGWYGQPLYEYLVLPTFGGSGSWLSPFYYLTLLIHVPVTDRILGR